MKYIFLIIVVLLIIVSCASKKEITKTIWVNSSKIDCQGVAQQKCMQIQEGKKLDPEKWEYFSDEIKGFTFVPGQVSKILVSEKKLPKEQVPADASNTVLSLVKIIEVYKDKPTNTSFKEIEGSWKVTTLKNITPQKFNSLRKKPSLNFKGTTISGNNGCNNISTAAEFNADSSFKIKQIIATRMLCLNMEVSNTFNTLLKESTSFKLLKKQLILLNDKGEEIITLSKK